MRKLVPISQLTPAQVDQLRMTVAADLLAEAERKGHARDTMVVTDLLPNTDLNVTGATGGANDYWNTPACVANTETDIVNHALDDDEFVAIYGIAMDDANPVTKVVKCLVGTAIVLAQWNLQELFCDMIPIGLTEEYPKWIGGDTVHVTMFSNPAKPAGDNLVLIGLICQPKGKRITK